MLLKDFNPRSMLVTSHTVVNEPRFPIVDAHNHLGVEFGGGWIHRPLPELLELLDKVKVRVYVDLDGGWGEDILDAHLDHFKTSAPERFRVFGGVDWAAWEEHGDSFGEWAAASLRAQAGRGADGLKIWRTFGINVRDHHGKLVAIDDPRLDPLWETAAEMGLPVLMHVAEPVASFMTLDNRNERWEHLNAHPEEYYPSPPYPSFISILTAMANLIERHSATTFIGAHMGCYAENLNWVGNLLDRCPNFYVDMSARIGELGRQPYSARKFFIKYADRILFGLDTGPVLEAYRLQYRFLETDDEYFSYTTSEVPAYGRWYVHGLYLPEDVLEKVYYLNAERVLLSH